jgi:hypothetical protein
MSLTTYVGQSIVTMPWAIALHTDFDAEFDNLREAVQDELLALMGLLEHFGPSLGRPRVGTLKGSKHPNMKELRFEADGGVWRVAFAFDPKRRGILLAAGETNQAPARRDSTAS